MFHSLFLLALLITRNTHADFDALKVVYGDDDRYELFEKKKWAETASSVGLMVSKDRIENSNSPLRSFNSPTLETKYGLCSDQRFVSQPSLGTCSGFLIAPDLLLTAGHCIERNYDCENNYWVFDFVLDQRNGIPKYIKNKDIYECKQIISQSFQVMEENEPDYTLIRLSRVTNRKSLKLSTTNLPKVGDNVVLLGYPNGIPLKVADSAFVTKVKKARVYTNVDAFKSNSGGPIIDEKSGLVIGILVNGENDYNLFGNTCYDVNIISDMKKGVEKATLTQSLPLSVLNLNK